MKDRDDKLLRTCKEINVENRKEENGGKKKIDSTLEDIFFTSNNGPRKRLKIKRAQEKQIPGTVGIFK